MKKFLTTGAIVISLVYSSCNKSSDPVLTRGQLLASPKGWITTAITINPEIFGSADFFASYTACNKDDILFFTSEGNYRREEGATKCSPADPTIWDQGTWKLNSDKTTITETSFSSVPVTYTILELTSSIFKITREQPVDSINYVFTITSSAVK